METDQMLQVPSAHKLGNLALLLVCCCFLFSSCQRKIISTEGLTLRSAIIRSMPHTSGIVEGRFNITFEGKVDSIFLNTNFYSLKDYDLKRQFKAKLQKLEFNKQRKQQSVCFAIALDYDSYLDSESRIKGLIYLGNYLEQKIYAKKTLKKDYLKKGNRIILIPIIIYGGSG